MQGVSGAGNVITVNISPDPFTPAEITAASTADGPIVMLDARRQWMGRVTSYVSTSLNVATVTVNTLDQDLANATTVWAPGCPMPEQRAELMAVRRRYLVYQSASTPGQPGQFGLYLQTNNCDPFNYDAGTACSAKLGTPRMVSGGIHNRQIVWHVPGMADGGTADGWCQVSPRSPAAASTSQAPGTPRWRRAFTGPRCFSPRKAPNPTGPLERGFPSWRTHPRRTATTSSVR